MTKKLKLVYDNVDPLVIDLLDNEVAEIIYKQFKHLQHVPIPQYAGDNPFNTNMIDWEWLSTAAIAFGFEMGISIDSSRLTEQAYLNDLHQQYEQRFPVDRNTDWHKFHEIIHAHEHLANNTKSPDFVIVYNNIGGPLQCEFHRQWLKQFGTVNIDSGSCYVSWSELGKHPTAYWKNKEPDSINRICELAKPWLTLRPKFHIALTDRIDMPTVEVIESFSNWFAPYKDAWCEHWGLTDWTLEEMFQVIKIGTIDNVSILIDRLRNNIRPNYVKLA